MKKSDFIIKKFSISDFEIRYGFQNIEEAVISYLENNEDLTEKDFKVINPRGYTNEFTALYEPGDPDHIYAYRIEKHKEKRIRNPEKNTNQPWVVTAARYWEVTLYKLPLKNLIYFEKFGHCFQTRIVDDQATRYHQDKLCSLPKRSEGGYFECTSENFQLFRALFNKACALKEVVTFDKEPEDTPKQIEIHFDRENLCFGFFYTNGEKLSDEHLKEILN